MNIWHDIAPEFVTPERFVAVIEITRGGKNKYELDKATGMLRLDRVLYTSTHYPANYGFIPRTYADDGDPLDVLVLCSEAIEPMTLVECRPIGMFSMNDGDSRDEKIIAVPMGDPNYNFMFDISQLPQHVLEEIQHFFTVYKALEGRTTVVGKAQNREVANKIIIECIENYKKKFCTPAADPSTEENGLKRGDRMRPLIGVTPSHDAEKAQLYVRENYLSAVSDAGGYPVVLQQTDSPELIGETLERLDGLLLSGGGDVEPSYYGAEASPRCGQWDSARDAFEVALTLGALARGLPVFGICRGCQTLAVALGGTLIQDIEDELGIPAARHNQSPPYDRPTHDVLLTPGGLLSRITGKARLSVNSSHHQAVRNFGEKMVPEAVSEDGVTEGFSLSGREDVFAVQFHPEHMAYKDPDAAALFRYFVSCAARYRDARGGL